MTPSTLLLTNTVRVKVKWVAGTKGTSVRGSNLPQEDIYNAIIKEKKLICRGKKLNQFTPVNGQIYRSPKAFIWLARWKLLQI